MEVWKALCASYTSTAQTATEWNQHPFSAACFLLVLLFQDSVLVFVVGHDVAQKRRQPFGDKRAYDDPVGKLDGHFVFRHVECLVHAEEENDLLTGSRGVANVSVNALCVGVFPTNLNLWRCANPGCFVLGYGCFVLSHKCLL